MLEYRPKTNIFTAGHGGLEAINAYPSSPHDEDSPCRRNTKPLGLSSREVLGLCALYSILRYGGQ